MCLSHLWGLGEPWVDGILWSVQPADCKRVRVDCKRWGLERGDSPRSVCAGS